MTEDWRRPYADQDLEAMWQNAQFSRKLSIVCIGLAQGTITAQFIMVVVFDVNDKGNSTRAPYMTSYFPYDTKRSPNYELTWLAQLLSNVFAAGAFSAVDAFFAVLVLHLCGQLAIVRRATVQLANESRGIQGTKDFTKRLANIVERHEHLNRLLYTEKINTSITRMVKTDY